MSDQPSLFDGAGDDEPRTHARRTDPATSHEAARMAAYPQKWRILAALARYPHPVLTALEAASAAGIPHHGGPGGHAQRLSDLKGRGWVEVAGTVPSPTGRPCQLYRVTPAGVAALEAYRTTGRGR